MNLKRPYILILSIGAPIAIIAAGVLSIVIMGMLKPEADKTETVSTGQPVFAAPAILGKVRLSVSEQGEVRPVHNTGLSASVAGKVVSVSPSLVDGGAVEKDEIMVRIEPSDYRLALVQAQSEVARAEQVLARVTAEAQIAQRDWKELGEGEASALALRLPQLAEAKAALAAAIARSEDAALRLERTNVRSPFRGRVQSRKVELGQYVAPGQVLAEIYAIDEMEVALKLSGQQLSNIGLPLAYNASAEDNDNYAELFAEIGDKRVSWPGRIVRTGARIDPVTRLVSVYINVLDPFSAKYEMPLAPGLFVDVTLPGREVDNVMIVPRSALRGNDLVYLVEDDDLTTPGQSMRVVKVQTLFSNPEHAYITKGISPGDMVVISPVQAVFDGMKIHVIEKEGGSVASASAATGARP